MCGIAGIISLSGKPIENGDARVNKMLQEMGHRGPDGSGFYKDNNNTIFLGNNRLAITDPSFKLDGPLISDCNDYILSYNGEIYDFKEHFYRLANKKILFHSKTDTEVLLKGLIYEGVDFLEKIDGCWAFALYNKNSKKIILSRDLLGEKHIFYYKDNNEFIFASEASAVELAIKGRTNFDMKEILTSLRFFSSSSGNTIIKEIKKFKPGQTLIIENKERSSIKEIYPLKLNPFKWSEYFKNDPSDNSVIESLSELMFNSIKNRLSPDVPFFTTLSGGIDSNLISYFASKEKKNLDTVFIQTSNHIETGASGELTEKEASRYTSKLLKTNHLEINAELNNPEFLLKKNAQKSFDGLLDWGVSSFELIGKAVKKQGYKVLLVSEAADELCGYPVDYNNYAKYKFNLKYQNLSSFLNILNSNKLIRKIFRRINFVKNNIFEPHCTSRPFIFQPHHEAAGYDYLEKIFDGCSINQTNKAYGSLSEKYNYLENKVDYSQKMALSYASFSLPDFSNLRLDRALMASSVEPRIPFLNLNLVNFFLAMPPKYRFRNGYSKFILRKMVEKYIGKKIAWRSKYGFSYPLWKLPNVKKNLDIEEKIFNSNIINFFPWNKNGMLYLKNNIGNRLSKLSWPLYSLAELEKKLSK